MGWCGVDAGLLLFRSSRVTSWLIFFSTISHCPWRDFISFSNGEKETKQRKRLSTDGTEVSRACSDNCLVLQKNARRRSSEHLKPSPSVNVNPHASPPVWESVNEASALRALAPKRGSSLYWFRCARAYLGPTRRSLANSGCCRAVMSSTRCLPGPDFRIDCHSYWWRSVWVSVDGGGGFQVF